MSQVIEFNQYADPEGDIHVDEPWVETSSDGRKQNPSCILAEERRRVEHESWTRNQHPTQTRRAKTPAENLPYELLGTIFWLVNTPVLLSRVCKTWFAASRAFGALWSTVFINTDHENLDYCDLRDQLDSLNQRLARSKKAELTVTIKAYDWQFPDAFGCFASVLEPELGRVVSFTLNITRIEYPADISVVLSLLGGSLQHLQLRVATSFEPPLIHLPPSSINLRSLHLRGTNPTSSFAPSSYPLLEHLELQAEDNRHHPSNWGMVTALLQHTPRLQTLTVHHFSSDPSSAFAQVNLPDLHQLKMVSMSNLSMEWLLGRLTLPGLRSIIVRRDHRGHAPFSPDLPNFTGETKRIYNEPGVPLMFDDVIWSKGEGNA